jgi:protocadherin-16/23
LNIQARGEGLNNGPPVYGNAQVNITISDINDNIPQFAVPTVEIPVKEDMSLGSMIYAVHAVDADSGDNGRVRYSIQDPSDIFSVNPETGEINLKRKLDHETTTRHEFMVHAYDLGPGEEQASMTVIVDVQDINDNKPVFEKSSYIFDVSEAQSANFKFGEVKATDADSANNGKVRYLVQNGQNVDMFGVYADEGFLYNRVKLDRERRSEYSFVVLAVDNGVPALSSSASVTVRVLDANDNDPIFQESPYVFQIPENQPPHTLVGVVSATDKDETNQLIYFFESSTRYFAVNPESGEVLSSVQLDREEVEMHTLKVIVSDQGNPPRSSSVEVRIHIQDVNDNYPVFEKEGVFIAYINENQPEGTLVAQLFARDVDKGENANISYSFFEGWCLKTYFISVLLMT